MREVVTYEHLVDLLREMRSQFPDATQWPEFREVERLLMLPESAREPVRVLLGKAGLVELRPPRPSGICGVFERWAGD